MTQETTKIMQLANGTPIPTTIISFSRFTVLSCAEKTFRYQAIYNRVDYWSHKGRVETNRRFSPCKCSLIVSVRKQTEDAVVL